MSPGTHQRLVMGPWSHGGWSRSDGARLGPVPFSAKTAEFYREEIQLPFFQYYSERYGVPQVCRSVGVRDRRERVEKL